MTFRELDHSRYDSEANEEELGTAVGIALNEPEEPADTDKQTKNKDTDDPRDADINGDW